MGKNVFLLTVSLTLSVSLPGAGATWHVSQSVESSGDGASRETAFKTIQEGIDASSDGDTVTVAEGTYVENIHFNGQNITLRSTDPLDPSVVAATIIDGNQSGSVVTFSGTETEACTLSGLTIRNGRGQRGGGICGGTWETPMRATIEHNVIVRNFAEYDRGGLAYCAGAVRGSSITDNSAWYGGGLALCGGTIRDNIIVKNLARSRGGALSSCNGTVENNSIISNVVTQDYGQGGGLFSCRGRIRNNTISGNRALAYGGWGGGLASCSGLIEANTITAKEFIHNKVNILA